MTTSLLFSKIVSLGYAAPRRQTLPTSTERQEQRREFRRASQDRLFVQVVDCEDDSQIGTTLSCDALDVSASGLKIASKQPISVGAVLDLWVDDSQRPGKFFLSSRVRWTRREEGQFQIGVELINGAATDILEWRDRQS